MSDEPIDDREITRMTARADQAHKAYCEVNVAGYASFFRAFCAQEGVTREEALRMTLAIISARETVTMALVTGTAIRRQAEEGGP